MKINITRWMVAAVTSATLAASAYNKSVYPYEVPAGGRGVALGATYAEAGMELEPGKWYTNFAVCKKYADDNGMPMLAVWGNHSCIHCWFTECCFVEDAFTTWVRENNAGQVILCIMAGGEKGAPDQKNSNAYNWMWYAGGGRTLSEYPFVVMWWKKQNVNVRLTGDEFCAKIADPSDPNNPAKVKALDKFGFTDSTIPARIANMTARMEAAFAGWVPTKYAGGMFAGGAETTGNRLEVARGVTNVTFSLVRDAAVAAEAATNLLVVAGADNAVETNDLAWAAGETNKIVALDVADFAASAANGDALTLILLDEKGEAQDTRTVTYVERENAADNPLWIGERTAETLAFGEWTADFDLATNKVAQTAGDAYTLVSVGGSLWCPDCANTERNFLGVTDASGATNRFRAWAADNNVALVALDIPNFAADGTPKAPTLLSRTAFETTLARAREFPASGADAALTNALLRSGLGYLTRKGVTDEAAAAALKRNFSLVAADGLLRSPLDANPYRTGVPIFVLLRKDGTAAARLTRFDSVSPMADARAKWGDIIKRFDEMLALAAAGPDDPHYDLGPANDAPGEDAPPLAADNGTAQGELSHADFRDVFRLDGMDGNALQKVTVKGVKGTTGARVALSFLTTTTNGGERVTLGAPVVGALTADGFSAERTFTASGRYYVEVAGANITNAEFAVDCPTNMNFHAYTLESRVVLVPQEARATAKAGAGSKAVTMRLEKGATYRIEGLDATAVGDALAPDDRKPFFTALKNGDVVLTTEVETVTYQIWKPGTVGFVQAARTVKENVGEVQVTVARTGGASGAVTLTVALDEAQTTLYNSDGAARFAFERATLVWADGETGEKTVAVKVEDDTRFDGTGVVALALEQTGGDGTPEVGVASFALTVTDDDTQSAGKAAFVGAEPYFARAKTVYVREGEAATVKVGRVEASDGPVTVRVKASPATVALGGDVADGVLAWANHKSDTKTVTVAGLAAGKTATLTLANATDGLKILSASNSVKVVAVAADAPAFAQNAAAFALTRYVAASNVYKVVDCPEGTTKLTFTKLSGTLPAGLKAAWDADANALALSGVPTAKAGLYTPVYQVSARVGNRTVPGLTLALAITVVDVAAPGADGAAALNPALAKTRTFRDLPVLGADEGNTPRLVGTLQVTVPATGRVSAKLLCETGTVSFTARNWTETDDDGTMTAELVGAKTGWTMTLKATADGALKATVENGAGEFGEAETDGRLWSKTDSAEAWRGQYTVALRNAAVTETTVAGLAPRGDGYLTLKMTSATAWNAGRMTWAGHLPNGTAVSGSATFANTDCGARLPVYVRSSRDVLAVLMNVVEDVASKAEPEENCQAVSEDDSAEAYWRHRDAAGLEYQIEWDVYGGAYSPSYDFADYFEQAYQTGAVAPKTLVFDVEGLGGTLAAGVPEAVDPIAVSVGATTLAVVSKDGTNNSCRATLAFNRTTGVVSGTFRLPYAKEDGMSATVTATYRGVMLIGLSEGCGCGPEADGADGLPFVNGAFWVTDKATDERGRMVSVKRGGAAVIADRTRQ